MLEVSVICTVLNWKELEGKHDGCSSLNVNREKGLLKMLRCKYFILLKIPAWPWLCGSCLPSALVSVVSLKHGFTDPRCCIPNLKKYAYIKEPYCFAVYTKMSNTSRSFFFSVFTGFCPLTALPLWAMWVEWQNCFSNLQTWVVFHCKPVMKFHIHAFNRYVLWFIHESLIMCSRVLLQNMYCRVLIGFENTLLLLLEEYCQCQSDDHHPAFCTVFVRDCRTNSGREASIVILILLENNRFL